MFERSKITLVAAIAVIFVLSRFSHYIGPYEYDIILSIGINIILAVSLNLVNGYTGQFSLGHAGFMSVGAYTAAAFTTYEAGSFLKLLGPLGPLVSISIFFGTALLLGGLAAGATGLIVGIPSLRLKGDYLAIVTLGFGEIIKVVIENGIDWLDFFVRTFFDEVIYKILPFDFVHRLGSDTENFIKSVVDGFDSLGRSRGFSVDAGYTNLFWVYVMSAITIYVVLNLVNSTYGRGFLTVRDDEIAAEAMGINTTKYKVLAFTLAAFFAGIAGGLYAHFKQYINPEGFNFLKSVDIVTMVILGGMGSTVGVVLAAILLTIMPEILRWLAERPELPHWLGHLLENRMIPYSLLLILLMLTRPQGLFGSPIHKRAKA